MKEWEEELELAPGSSNQKAELEFAVQIAGRLTVKRAKL